MTDVGVSLAPSWILQNYPNLFVAEFELRLWLSQASWDAESQLYVYVYQLKKSGKHKYKSEAWSILIGYHDMLAAGMVSLL